MNHWSNEDDEQLQEQTDQLSSGIKSKYYLNTCVRFPQLPNVGEIFSSLSHPILVKNPPHLCFVLSLLIQKNR